MQSCSFRTGEEIVVQLTDADANNITQSLDGEGGGIFTPGTLQCVAGTQLGGVDVEARLNRVDINFKAELTFSSRSNPWSS